MPLPAIAVVAARLGIATAKYLIKKHGTTVFKKGAKDKLVKLINKKQKKNYDPNKPRRRPSGGFGDKATARRKADDLRIKNYEKSTKSN